MTVENNSSGRLIIRRIWTAFSHATTLVLLTFLTIRVLHNLQFFSWARRPDYLSPSSSPPYSLVSILVPARNEESTITACIESLVKQDYSNYEIIVLDDQSTDGTSNRLRELKARFPDIRVVCDGAAPPPGWNGKSFACHRLTRLATGKWLLFTDADTMHSPQSVSLGIRQATRLNVDLLSAMPYQKTVSWSEQLIVSFILDFLPLLGIDFWHLWQGHHATAIANGQYLLVRSAVYQELGGHEAIYDALVDDFALADLFVRGGRQTAMVNGTSMLGCRMYEGANELWHGFTKNILLALQTSYAGRWPWWMVTSFAWGYASVFVTPYCFLLRQPQKQLAMLEVGWLATLRLLVSWHYRRPFSEIFTTPLAAVGVILLGLHAFTLKMRGRPVVWKGRAYLPGQ